MTDPIKFLNPESVSIRNGNIRVEMCRDDDAFDFIEPADDYDVEVIITKKPLFEPGYFVDNSMTEEYRDEHGYGPRRVIWLDQDPHDTDWVRVNVTDRNF